MMGNDVSRSDGEGKAGRMGGGTDGARVTPCRRWPCNTGKDVTGSHGGGGSQAYTWR